MLKKYINIAYNSEHTIEHPFVFNNIIEFRLFLPKKTGFLKYGI